MLLVNIIHVNTIAMNKIKNIYRTLILLLSLVLMPMEGWAYVKGTTPLELQWSNYIKDKFGHSVSFIYPCWLKEEEVEEFEQDLKTIEKIYFKWIEKGWQAQQAATFLPQATKAEVIMTGFVSDFKHFFDLRALGTTGAPHPSVKELVEPLYNEFKTLGYV